MEKIDVEKQYKEPLDIILFISIIMLLGVGLAMLFSASYNDGLSDANNACFYLKKQLIMMVLGIFFACCINFCSESIIKKFTPFITLLVILLCFYTAFCGNEINGAKRWIIIHRISFQPSEFLKICLIFYLATRFIKDDLSSYMGGFIILGLSFLSVVCQRDFSTSFFIACLGLAMILVSPVKKSYLIMIIGIMIVGGAFFVLSSEYRMERLIHWFNPALDIQGSGWQGNKSLSAICDGGFWGKGIGASYYKQGVLPEAKSDYIFAVVCEEMGFLGVILIIALYCVFAWRGYSVAFACDDKFRFYIAFGITTAIFFQAMVNMGIVSGILPPTGIPLPFFSQGGSSICVTVIMSFILLKISREKEIYGGAV